MFTLFASPNSTYFVLPLLVTVIKTTIPSPITIYCGLVGKHKRNLESVSRSILHTREYLVLMRNTGIGEAELACPGYY